MTDKLFLAQADVYFIVSVGDSKSNVASKIQRLVWAVDAVEAEIKFSEYIKETSENGSFEYKIAKLEITPALE